MMQTDISVVPRVAIDQCELLSDQWQHRGVRKVKQHGCDREDQERAAGQTARGSRRVGQGMQVSSSSRCGKAPRDIVVDRLTRYRQRRCHARQRHRADQPEHCDGPVEIG